MTLEQKMHGVLEQMLDEFTAQHQIEARIGIRIWMPLSVEQINLACKIGLPGNLQRLSFVSRWCSAVVGAPYAAITQHPLERRSRVHIGAKLQRASSIRRRQ